MKMEMRMKNRSHRHNVKRPGPWHGHRYSKSRKCLGMMMLVWIQQQLSNIRSTVHEKVKQHWGWVEKKRCL